MLLLIKIESGYYGSNQWIIPVVAIVREIRKLDIVMTGHYYLSKRSNFTV
jgi:hypothetical protein